MYYLLYNHALLIFHQSIWLFWWNIIFFIFVPILIIDFLRCIHWQGNLWFKNQNILTSIVIIFFNILILKLFYCVMYRTYLFIKFNTFMKQFTLGMYLKLIIYHQSLNILFTFHLNYFFFVTQHTIVLLYRYHYSFVFIYIKFVLFVFLKNYSGIYRTNANHVQHY